jgi:hypothetical protein
MHVAKLQFSGAVSNPRNISVQLVAYMSLSQAQMEMVARNYFLVLQ